MKQLKVAVSVKALFDMEKEDNLYHTKGLDNYIEYNEQHKEEVLKPGKAFDLVKSMLDLNTKDKRVFDVILMSRTSASIAPRIYKSVEHYGLSIKQACFTSGDAISQYAICSKVDLYLSSNEADVQDVLDSGIAAKLIK